MPKRVIETPLTGKTKDGEILSKQEELFCNEYVLNKGNGTQSAMNSHNAKNRNHAGVLANSLLRNNKILKRINELVDKHIMTDEEADFELTKVIRQDAEFTAKNKGLDIYNKLKGRYEKHNEQQKDEINLYSWSEYEKKQDNDLPPEMVDQTASREQKEMDCNSGSS